MSRLSVTRPQFARGKGRDGWVDFELRLFAFWLDSDESLIRHAERLRERALGRAGITERVIDKVGTVERGPIFTKVFLKAGLEHPSRQEEEAKKREEANEVEREATRRDAVAAGVDPIGPWTLEEHRAVSTAAGERLQREREASLPAPGPGIPVSDLVPSWTERYDTSLARLDALKVQHADLIGLSRSVIDALTGEGGLDERMRRMELALGISPKVVPDRLVNLLLVPAPEGSEEEATIAGAAFESGLDLFRLEDETLGDFLQRAILQTGA